jgi:hypothetical protein
MTAACKPSGDQAMRLATPQPVVKTESVNAARQKQEAVNFMLFISCLFIGMGFDQTAREVSGSMHQADGVRHRTLGTMENQRSLMMRSPMERIFCDE